MEEEIRLKKEKNKKLHIPWNKIGIALVLAFFLVFGIMVLRFRMNYHSPTEVYQKNVKYEIIWDGKTFSGIYKGDFQNTQPNGFGSFEDREGKLKYTGIWQKGIFTGVGIITYADGSIEAGEFKEGKRDGIIRYFEPGKLTAENEKKLEKKIRSIYDTVTQNDKGDTFYNIYNDGASLGRTLWKEGDISENYVETIYEENIPYARSDSYENGQLVSAEYYINATPMSEITKEAKPLTEKLIKKEGYKNSYVYIDGEVEFAGDTSAKSYFRFNTKKISMAYCGYESTYGRTSDQAYVPSLKKGDKIRVYGYYMGLSGYNIYTDTEGTGNRYAKIMPILVVKTEDIPDATDDNGSTDQPNTVTDDSVIVNGISINRCVKDGQVNSYSGILDNPYFSNMEKIEDEFVIKSVKNSGLKYTIKVYKDKAPDEIYTLIYYGDVLDKFLTGSTIKVSGYLAGQIKIINKEAQDELIEDGKISEDVTTYEFEKQPVIMVEELSD